jgi:hypothetical protein
LFDNYILFPASPDATALHSTITSSAARAHQWKPLAFRLIRACAFINRRSHLTAAAKFALQMDTHGKNLADVASAIWTNGIINHVPVESSLQALISTAAKSSVTWVCSCCVYASQYALVCAFFAEHGSNAFFVDVISGSACSCFPVNRAGSLGPNIVACAYAQEFVAATDAMSLFLYRSSIALCLWHA